MTADADAIPDDGLSEFQEGGVEACPPGEDHVLSVDFGHASVPPSDGVAKEGARGHAEQLVVSSHIEDDGLGSVAHVCGLVQYAGAECDAHSPERLGVPARHHVKHALVLAAALEPASVVSTPVAVPGIGGAVEEATPALLLGWVGERGTERAPNVGPFEFQALAESEGAILLAFPVVLAVRSHAVSDAFGEDDGHLVDGEVAEASWAVVFVPRGVWPCMYQPSLSG